MTLQFFSLLFIILHNLPVSYLMPVSRVELPFFGNNRIIAVPKTSSRLLINATEQVRNRFLHPKEFLLIDESSDPFISIDFEEKYQSSANSPPLLNSSFGSTVGDNSKSTVLSFIRVIFDLIAKLSVEDYKEFVDMLWKFTENCKDCGNHVDQSNLMRLIETLRMDLATNLDFSGVSDWFNCYKFSMPNPFQSRHGWNDNQGQRRFLKGGYNLESSLWPHGADIQMHGIENGHRLGNRQLGEVYTHTTPAHLESTQSNNHTAEILTATSTELSRETATPNQSSEKEKQKMEEDSSTKIEAIIDIPEPDNDIKLNGKVDRPKRPKKKPKKNKAYLWHFGRDLEDYEDSFELRS